MAGIQSAQFLGVRVRNPGSDRTSSGDGSPREVVHRDTRDAEAVWGDLSSVMFTIDPAAAEGLAEDERGSQEGNAAKQ